MGELHNHTLGERYCYTCGPMYYRNDEKEEDMPETRLVEINGVKLEVDLREARTVEQYRVGDKIKVLIKHYGDNFKVNAGMIVQFNNFEQLPTIVVAYIDENYSNAELKFAYINAQTKDIEICPAGDDELAISKAFVLDTLSRQITAKQEEIRQLEEKQNYILNKFDAWFGKGADNGDKQDDQ
jgi:uncharacterized coiled-coil protein SlyX